MKRKLLIAIPFLVIIAIIVVILILTREKGAEEQVLLADSGYPISVAEDGAELRVTLDGSKTKDFTWSAKIENEDLISISLKGEEKKGKATYVISPKMDGYTSVEFTRAGNGDGAENTAVSIVFSVLVYRDGDNLRVSRTDETYIRTLNETGGVSLEYPFLLENREDGTAVITFPKGESDWIFLDPDGIVETGTMVGPKGENMRNVALVTAGEPSSGESAEAPQKAVYWEAEMDDQGKPHLVIKDEETERSSEADYYDELKEKYKGHSSIAEDGSGITLLLAISKSQNVTEFIRVNIDAEGSIWIAMGDEPK